MVGTETPARRQNGTVEMNIVVVRYRTSNFAANAETETEMGRGCGMICIGSDVYGTEENGMATIS